jgi:hypothetical protein
VLAGAQAPASRPTTIKTVTTINFFILLTPSKILNFESFSKAQSK